MSANPNIAARLEERAALYPQRPAIIQGRGLRRRVLTFGALAERVARLAGGLSDAGLRPGERALVFVPMSADLYTALLALLHLGSTAVFVDAWASRKRLERAVAVAAPRAFIGSPKAHLLRLLSPTIRRIPLHLMAGPGPLGLGKRFGAAIPAARVEADTPALVTFTTGSTGQPKATARSHGFLWAQHEALARHLGLREGDVDLPTLPVFILNNLALGVTSVLPAFDPRRPADVRPAVILRQMREEGVTTTCGSPAFYERLAEHLTRKGGAIPVTALFTGGAPVFPSLAKRLQEVTAGSVHVIYGSTEVEPVSGITASELVEASKDLGALGVCVGRPVPEIDMELIRPTEGPVELGSEGLGPWRVAPGDAGEIVVAGRHVLEGYLDDPEGERRNKIRDGGRVWHRTGDGGRLDRQGRLWLLGRVSQRVLRGGETWWSMAAEARALEVDGVVHAAYLGLEATAVLCLEVEKGADASTVTRRAREALAPIPVDEVLVLPRIPRDPRHQSKTDGVRTRALAEARRRG